MIRVVIAEDQKMLRGALGTLLDFENDIKVVGQADDGKQALKMIDELQPDICLLDIEMPVLSGLDVAQKLKEKGARCKIIILTTFARPGYFERALEAEVDGYLLKDGSVEELAESIRKIMTGKKEFAPELVINSLKTEQSLTEREREILKLSSEGYTYKEISEKLYLSSGTVRNYMSDILQKLEAKNKVEAIRFAKDKGWI